MKHLRVLCSLLLILSLISANGYASKILWVPSGIQQQVNDVQHSLEIAVSQGEIWEFSTRDLEIRLGLNDGMLQGGTFTALPSVVQGELILNGIGLEAYQFLTREELNQLCFVPNEKSKNAVMTLLPQGHDSKPVQISVNILSHENAAPIIEDAKYTLFQNTKLIASINAYDPDNDTIYIKVTRPPQKGSVSFNGTLFTYQPFAQASGNDKFFICAYDRFGNYSKETTVDITMEENKIHFIYIDMTGNPSEYAVVKLHENGVYTGEKSGMHYLFHPERHTTRGDFLVMLLSACNMSYDLDPTVNTHLPGDSKLPPWLKPYIKKAIAEGIWQNNTAFAYDEVLSRAEAVMLTARAAKITDVKDFTLTLQDALNIPDWAIPYYKNLSAYRMLDLHDGLAKPTFPLTTSYSADLCWQLWKHVNR